MMSKAPRWHETLVNTKTTKVLQKHGEKNSAAGSGGKQATKTSIHCGKSLRGGDSAAVGSKGPAGGGVSVGHRGGQQAATKTSNPVKPAVHLRSSQSFSSLQSTSLTAAPFTRSSRSLSRLDQRSPDPDNTTAASSQVKKGRAAGRKILDSVRLASSVEQISSTRSRVCSSGVSTTTRHHHDNKEKKQSKDGVYTLCAMTSGMRRNWVQAVLKNVRPGLPQELTSSVSEQKEEQQEENRTTEQRDELQPIGAQSSADADSSSSVRTASPSSSPAPSPSSPLQVVEESQRAQLQILDKNTKTGVTGSSLCAEEFQSGSLSSASVDGDREEHPNADESTAEHSAQRCETIKEEQQVSGNPSCTDEEEKPHREQQTVQLVKELQQTQRELSRIQQLNKNLQEELRQERERHLGKLLFTQNGTTSFPEQALTLQQMQKINHNLRMELEALKRSQEEAREAELLRRVDLLAQQAQLLVTGDATVLSQIHLEQDLQQFQEHKLELERCTSSLKSQLDISEEKRKEAEAQLLQMQQELQSHQNLQEEAEELRKHLQEMSGQLHAYEEAQAEKEARLQKHLMLLQASQERERKGLAVSLAQAEHRSKDLQDKLGRAEQQLETFNKSQTLSREIEDAQRQLQDELACTVSAVQQLQEERKLLHQRCQELQNQLSEADRAVSRLQDRLKTEETHYYNLEHSYERACEELQVALGKVQQREFETQDIREGYERLLDRKEQELSEVLLKMEVLGNSLEETEVKLSELMKVCTCSSSRLNGGPSEPAERKNKQQQTPEYFTVNESRMSSSVLSNSPEVMQANCRDPHQHARTRSLSADASFSCITNTGDDPEKFVSMIQLLETKLFVTEEKLKDLTHRLAEHQSHIGCQDPHLSSELTQSRATAQHLSLLLHSQAKQSQRFAQETENRCRMLVGRFQVALNIIQACRERLQAAPVNIPDIERQLARAVGCLQQGEQDAGRVQHDSRNVFKEEGKLLADEKLTGAESDFISKLANAQPSQDMSSTEKHLIKELFVVENMVSVLQNQNGICELSSAKNREKVARSYKNLISQRIHLKAEERAAPVSVGCDSGELLESVIGRLCAEAELLYAALKLQQQCEGVAHVNGHEDHQGEALADISPSELASYGEQVKVDSRGSDEAGKPDKKGPTETRKLEVEKEKGLLEKLVSRLQRRAKFLHHICQELTEDSVDHSGDDAPAVDFSFFQEQVKLIYLSDRLYLDLEQEFQPAEASQNNLHALQKEREEQEMLSHALNRLQEDNISLKEELELAEQKIVSVETGNQRLLEDMRRIEDHQKEQREKVETEFHEKIKELQQIHEEEMTQLHGYYSKACASKERQMKACSEAPPLGEDTSLSGLTATERNAKEELGPQTVEVDAAAMREAYLKDLEKLQASCDHGFAAMEEMHKKVIKDLQQQHQEKMAELLKEKDQLLQEETAATMAAIVAMRRAHKKELEKSKQTRHNRESADITELHMEYEKEIQLLHKELEVLSAQHTKKCLENSQLNQELQNERESVVQYQKENQRETDEMSQLPGHQSHVGPQVADFYQLELVLRAKEAELQCLKQESHSLKEELEITRMDKAYAENKLKDLQRTNQHKDAFQHLDKDSKFATWSPSRDTSGCSLENSGTTNIPPFPKKREKSSFLRQIRGFRSKSLKDGLSIQEKMKLFDSF
ncbi:nuclear mitotic apparatus protein 1 [Nematolebias whitei]|uniref:nuclear mitotic apparatus protein 1 n=1 Tax=Nematolebias whitei TaxID=451745 RepID=UPI00189B3E89|nr:nuclear mitotic apparatus protein 1 [Nematolebias whitei]